jgi:ABC-type branched-subunit amino acid transport system ATPase component
MVLEPPMFRIEALTTGYTDVPLVSSFTAELHKAEIVALLGANGSGKTTVLRCVMGFLPAWGGKVELNGLDLTRLPVHARVRAGLSLMPSGRRLFAGISVEDNLRVGAYSNPDRAGIDDRIEQLYELFPEVRERAAAVAGKLSGGEQQMVALGRALMTSPEALLIDEMSLGLAPVVVQRLIAALREIRDRFGVPIFFVEQDVHRALEIADRAYVLAQGHVALSGPAAELRTDLRLIRAYMGGVSAEPALAADER